MSKRFRNAAWFLNRPQLWAHGAALGVRKFKARRDTADDRQKATQWASGHAVGHLEALESLGLPAKDSLPTLPGELIDEATARSASVPVEMGAAADLTLVYATACLSGAEYAIETGVAYGWSTLALLAAIAHRPHGRLISVDMPYPNRSNEPFVGIVVPDRYRHRWELIRRADRPGIRIALGRFRGPIDLCHYDSDKSYWGRSYGYRRLWSALRTNGIFMSDDIDDNLAFAEFVSTHNSKFAVVKSGQRYVGIVRKGF